jgi:hypothetical protein
MHSYNAQPLCHIDKQFMLKHVTMCIAGEWSDVNGFCIPDGRGECDSGYPTVPEPDNSYGWSCTTMGWGKLLLRVLLLLCYVWCTVSCKAAAAAPRHANF